MSINAINSEGGELYGVSDGDHVSSTDNETTYDFKRANGSTSQIDPDYIQNLGDGYSLLIDTEGRTAVVTDSEGNAWEVWGDPHVTWSKDGEFQAGFDFINNITIELPNDKKVTFVTTKETINGMTLLDEVVVFDPREDKATSYKMEADSRPNTATGQAAYDIENDANDGGIVVVGDDLGDVDFYHENGEKAEDVWRDKNDITADFATRKGVQNEVIDIHTGELVESLDADLDLITDRDGLALAVLLLAVLQDRQEGLEKLLRFRLSDLDGNNANVNKINAILNSVQAGIEGDGEDPVKIPSEAYDFMVRTNVLDPNDPNIAPHISYDEKTDTYNIKGSVVQQSLKSKAEELQSLSQQMQQEVQFNFSSLTTSSELLTSTLRSFFEMLKSIAQKI